MVILLSACAREKAVPEVSSFTIEVPTGFPEMLYPVDNAPTQARIDLGRDLFHERDLSRNGVLACVHCHEQEHSFGHDVPVTPGTNGDFGIRNSPVLVNMGYHPYYFKDGGVPTLELQVKGPIEDPQEMDFTVVEAVERLQSHYQERARLAYGRDFDAFVLTRALASYVRILISGNSKYDQYINGSLAALDSLQLAGKDVFFGNNAKCSQCHSGFDFTNYSFQNNGLYQAYADSGRARITLDVADNGKFKVPTLRNIELSAPYMHDGSMNTLDEVLNHYQSGGAGHWNQSQLVTDITFTAQEKVALKAFLESLTDDEFINNPNL